MKWLLKAACFLRYVISLARFSTVWVKGKGPQKFLDCHLVIEKELLELAGVFENVSTFILAITTSWHAKHSLDIKNFATSLYLNFLLDLTISIHALIDHSFWADRALPAKSW